MLHHLYRYRYYLALLPLLIFLAVFFLIPLVEVLSMSVREGDGGLSNYAEFFSTPAYVGVLLRTVGMSLLVTAVCLLLAFPYAYTMSIATPNWRKVLIALVLLPFWTSLMVRSYAWVILLQDTGVVNSLLELVGLGPIPLIRNNTGVVIGMVQVLLPFLVLPLFSTLSNIDRRYVTAAISLGARPISAFRKVYLPLAAPGIAAGSLIVFVLSLGFFVTPQLLGSTQNILLSQLIQQQTNRLLNFGMGGTMAAVLLLSTLLILLVASRFVNPIQAYASTTTPKGAGK
ncbi:ABC transporter permease [Microbacterium sp. NPDC055910]|uniref:ABC transporter permease n=1 Tax=Microbacterium sp. NPDC055910 TaxID=3345659 RepID=UPI0035D86B80